MSVNRREPGARCWCCGASVPEDRLEFGSHLLPRTAGEGGPVLLYRCSSCGAACAVERNPAGEVLLSPPHLLGVRAFLTRGEMRREAKVWEAEHRRDRTAFLARTEPLPGEDAPPEPEGEIEAEADPLREGKGGGGETGGSRRRREPPPPGRDRTPSREIASILEAYEILDLPMTATAEDVKRSFRELSKRCHPDRVADLDEEIRRAADRRFREIRRAYELLLGG